MASLQASNKPNGSDIDFSVARPGTNVVLVAEGKEIHVNKEFLSEFSPYFAALLLSPHFAESSSPRVNIEYNYHNLLRCIEVVHGTGPLPIGEMDLVSLHNLIESAEFFDLPVVCRFCETELAAHRSHIVLMYHLACHYKFDKAKEVLFRHMNPADLLNWCYNGASHFRSPETCDLNLTAADLLSLLRLCHSHQAPLPLPHLYPNPYPHSLPSPVPLAPVQLYPQGYPAQPYPF